MNIRIVVCGIAFVFSMGYGADQSPEMVLVGIVDPDKGMHFGEIICVDSCKWLSGAIGKDIADVEAVACSYKCPAPWCNDEHVIVTFRSVRYQDSLMNSMVKYSGIMPSHNYVKAKEAAPFYEGLSRLCNQGKYIGTAFGI